MLHRARPGWVGAERGVRAIVTFFVVFYGVHGGEADVRNGAPFGLWEVGTTMYTAIVIVINLQMAQMINYWTWLHHVAIWGSVLIWYACNLILSDTEPYLSTFSYKIFTPTVAPAPNFWIATPVVCSLGLLPDLIWRGARRMFHPEPHHIVQEWERRDKRLRTSGVETGGGGATCEIKSRATPSSPLPVALGDGDG